jgi:nitrous oxide reductase accessory protein NosL
MRHVRALALLAFAALAPALSASAAPPATKPAAATAATAVPKPGPRDLCPVCGMLVSKYPHWVATITYKDGHAHHFDGAKDLFKFWFDPPKYAPGHKREDMLALWVTDFYDLKRIDARKAHFVIGSDVLGPMGHELVALASAEDAQAFLKEHKGKRVLRFDEVGTALPGALDEGRV